LWNRKENERRKLGEDKKRMKKLEFNSFLSSPYFILQKTITRFLGQKYIKRYVTVLSEISWRECHQQVVKLSVMSSLETCYLLF
jgi:hypothetical protein